MTTKSKRNTPRRFTLRDEQILQPPIHPQSAHIQFDMSSCWDTTMDAQEQRRFHPGCANKGTPTVISQSKRVYNGCTSKQSSPNIVSQHPFKSMALLEQTSMINQTYNILEEEARIEKELMNGSYELNSEIMARLLEESRVEEGTSNGSYEEESGQGEEIAHNSIKKVRGPTYMDSVWGCPSNQQRHHVEYNEFGQPVGGKSSMLSHFLGSLARIGKYCPIDVMDWRAMPKNKKAEMIEIVKSRFYVPDTALKWTLSSIGDKWKNWKHDLKEKYWEDDVPLVNLIERQNDRRIELDQWIKLVTYWSSDEGKEKSKRNKKAREKKTMKQRTGKTSFAKVRDKMKKELGRPPKRYELFGVCFVRPNEESSDDASRKYLEMQACNNQLEEGSEDQIGPNDVFAQTMGPDRPGHVRMMGKGICPSDVWGELPKNTSSRILMEQQTRIKELETLLGQQRCGSSQVPSMQHGSSANPLSSRVITNLPIMVGAFVYIKSLFDPNKVVAKGCIQSNNPCSKVGGQLLGANWCEVNVKVVLEPEEELIRPYGNRKKMAHVLGDMIAWPCNLVTPTEN